MKSIIGLSICLTLTASTALAEGFSSGGSVQDDYALSQGPNATTVRQIEGLEVKGKGPPMKQCGSKDKACVQQVVAELKTRYPEQLKRWCLHVQTSYMMAQTQQATVFKSPGIMNRPAGYDAACR